MCFNISIVNPEQSIFNEDQAAEARTFNRRQFLSKAAVAGLAAPLLLRGSVVEASLGIFGHQSTKEQFRSPEIMSAIDQDGAITLNGKKFFMRGTWLQRIEDIQKNRRLGINTFFGTISADEQAFAQAVTESGAYYVGSYNPHRTTEPDGTIGWYLMDEADGYGVRPSKIPQTQRVSETGRFIFQTVTSHFWSGALPPNPPVVKEDYPLYFANADVIATDVYVYGQFCGNRWMTLPTVYDIQRELGVRTGDGTLKRSPGMWIETGPDFQTNCSDLRWPQLTPPRLRAEIWLAIAAGAKHINYFTWRGGGEWRSFDITPEIEDIIVAQNQLIDLLTEPLLSREIPVKIRQDSPVRASARLYEGSLYIVTVNSSEEPVTTSFSVDGLDTGRAEVWQENRSLKVSRGAMSDHFDPLAVHIYAVSRPF